MGYSHLNNESQIQNEIAKLNSKIEVCLKVRDTLNTAGWRDIIEPLLDRTIIDVLGGKIGDTWVSGKLDKARTDEKREFYIGLKQGLIDFHSRVKFHLTELNRLQEEHKQILQDSQVRFRQPLVEDTSYGVDHALNKIKVKKSTK